MPEYVSRKYVTTVDYIADFVGADIAEDAVKVAIVKQNVTQEVSIKQDKAGLAKDSTLLSLLPSRSSATKELSNFPIVESDFQDIDKSSLDGYSAIVVTVRATYDVNATAGVRVRWLYSPDGVNYDSPEDAEAQGNYEDLSFEAGATRQRTILIPIFADNVRIQIVNLDPAVFVTVDVWSWLMR